MLGSCPPLPLLLPLPSAAFVPGGRTSGPRAKSVAVCGARLPGAHGGPRNCGMAPRYDPLPRAPAPRPLPPASPFLPRPLLAGGTHSTGACFCCFPPPRFSPGSLGPAPRQVSSRARAVHRQPPRPRIAGLGGGSGCGARLIPGHKRESSPLGAHWPFGCGFPRRCRGFEGWKSPRAAEEGGAASWNPRCLS